MWKITHQAKTTIDSKLNGVIKCGHAYVRFLLMAVRSRTVFAHRSLLIKGEMIIINVPRDFVNCALLISEIPFSNNNSLSFHTN